MLKISDQIQLPIGEISFQAIRSQGAGGQNVNKVSTAIHLRFDIHRSSLPDEIKTKLLNSRDHRVSGDGVIVIKAQRYRSQEKNRIDAMDRLREFITQSTAVKKKRKPTRPTMGSKARRLDNKKRQSRLKETRGKVEF